VQDVGLKSHFSIKEQRDTQAKPMVIINGGDVAVCRYYGRQNDLS